VQQGTFGSGPMRVDGALAVSRALGDFHFKPANMAPEKCKVTAVPEVKTARCMAGDWLLLACDGVFDVMTNEEVHEFITQRLPAGKSEVADGAAMSAQLIRHCLEKGSKDNCTACFVHMLSNGVAQENSRELLQGPWQQSAPEIQAKYADFFSLHGFTAEAEAAGSASMSRKAGGASLDADVGHVGSSRDASQGAGATESGGFSGSSDRLPAAGGASAPGRARAPPPVAALTKALQAMRSTRAIQNAWRARRNPGGERDGAPGSSQGGRGEERTG